MAMNIQRKTSNIANVVSYDAAGNVTLPGTLTVPGQLKLTGYLTTSSFSGTLVGYLGFDSAGNILTTTSPQGANLTFNNSGSGSASGVAYNGLSAATISYNTIGAPSITGTNASGTWGISVTGTAASETLTTVTGRGATTATAIGAPNFYDANGSINVNLGSGGAEGRGVVAGYAGNAYSGIGYNIRHTATGYIAPGTDTSSYLLFTAGGFSFQGAPIGTAGRTLSFSTLATLSAAGVFNATNITVSGHQTLHANNYNSYAPTLTGTGASGTWGISISGNSFTASSTQLLNMLPNYTWAQSSLPLDFNQGMQLSFVGPAAGEGSWQNYGTLINARTYSGGGGSLQMFVPYSPVNGGTGLQVRFGNYEVSSGNAWTAWKVLLASDNFNSYAPTLTGTGASGTWGISISGSSAQLGGISSDRAMLKRRTRIHTDDGTSLNSTIIAPEMGFSYGGSGEPTGPYIAFGGLAGNIDYSCQLAAAYGNGGNDFKIRTRNDDAASWNTWKTIFTDGNYNSFVPTLLGLGASGTWPISITGNSNYAISAGSSTTALRIAFLDGPRDLSNRLPNSFPRSVNFDFVGAGTPGGVGNYAGVMTFTPWDGTTVSTGDSSYQLGFINETGINGTGRPGLVLRKGIDSTWYSWYTLWTTGNMDAPNRKTNASDYYDVNTWFAMNGTHGMYWPSYHGAHFHINSQSTYGQFQFQGSKGSYSGVYDAYSGVNPIMYDSSGNGGVYREGSGVWYWYYNVANGCLGIGGSTTLAGYKMYVNGSGVVSENLTAASYYVNGWFRNNANNTGLYSESTTMHWSSKDNGYWDASSTTTVSAIRLYTGGHVSAIRGYLFANSSNEIGLQDQNGSWLIRCASISNTYLTGTLTATGDVIAFSDARVKENVETVHDAVGIVSKLRGVTYNRTDVEDKSRKVGVIAQEVLEVLPEVVNQGDDGMYGVSYGNLVAVLIEAVKEQQVQIQDLSKQIQDLANNQ